MSGEPPWKGEPPGLTPWRPRIDLTWIVDRLWPIDEAKVGKDRSDWATQAAGFSRTGWGWH